MGGAPADPGHGRARAARRAIRAEPHSVEPTGSVGRWTGAGLAQSELLTEWLRSPLLPGFELDVSTLRVD